MIWNNSLYGNYRQRKFTDIWGNVEQFTTEWRDSELPKLVSDDSIKVLYYLLYARYGNSTIASSDENQFKYKVFSIIFQYGPSWEKRLELQAGLKELKIEDVMEDGGTAIYNHAFNPSQRPTTQTTEELDYINDQNVTKYKKSKVDAIATLMTLIQTDVTEEFISRFKKLFLTIVEPELPLWYVTELDMED